MIWIYDNAIVDDLMHSFNPENVPDPVVKVTSVESVIQLAAQIQDDKLRFPIVAVVRGENTPIDRTRTNFTAMHKGVSSVLDPVTNELYYERAIPIELNYDIHVLTTNTADMDEIIRELLFKYTSMYFLTTTIPYESKRKVRFGVSIIPDGNIERSSGQSEHIESGTLYESILPLRCEGCVLVNYTPAKLRRAEIDTGIINKDNTHI